MKSIHMTCKYCGLKMFGVPGKLSSHVRHYCPVKKAVRDGTTIHPPPPENGVEEEFDPVAVIESLDVVRIRKAIHNTTKRLMALQKLLVVAEALQPEEETVAIPAAI